MKFNVTAINSATERANKVALEFKGTDTMLDGMKFCMYAPKSLELAVGENDLPKWYADGIFGSKRGYVEKSLLATAGKDMRAKAFHSAICEALDKAKALNVGSPVLEQNKGEWIGEQGEKIMMLKVKVEKCMSSTYHVGFGWRHNGHGWEHPSWTTTLWKLTDEKGNVIMVRTRGDRLQGMLAGNTGHYVAITGTIESLGEFRGSSRPLCEAQV